MKHVLKINGKEDKLASSWNLLFVAFSLCQSEMTNVVIKKIIRKFHLNYDMYMNAQH